MKGINSIGVIGAGTMGSGITQLAAMAGKRTLLYDIAEEQLAKAKNSIISNLDKGIARGKVTEVERDNALQNIEFTTSINSLKADIIIEAVVERLDVKHELFHKLAEINGPDTILATNTSSIPITRIAAPIPNPERVVGMHFFNPAHIMRLVEVIAGVETSSEVVDAVYQLAKEMKRSPVIAKDSPGFIVNRVARHFYVEGLKVLEERVASHEDIDDLMQASGFKMGPFQLMDLIGVDTNFSVTTSMFDSFHQNAKFRPSRIQQQKVEAGHHGRKSGKGFYTYN